MVRVREFTRAFFHIHHVLFALICGWKSEVLTTMLLLLLTTFWIASSRSNWFAAKMNILSFKSSSLHTFNKDVFCDFFNVRNCQDGSCWPWNRERKVEVVQKFFKVNGRDSFAGDWSFFVWKSTTNQVKVMLKYRSYCSFFGADAALACVASPKSYWLVQFSSYV